jgi:hypothetical protein
MHEVFKKVSEKILKIYCSSDPNQPKMGPKRPSAAWPSAASARAALTRAPGRNLGLGRESGVPPGP